MSVESQNQIRVVAAYFTDGYFWALYMRKDGTMWLIRGKALAETPTHLWHPFRAVFSL